MKDATIGFALVAYASDVLKLELSPEQRLSLAKGAPCDELTRAVTTIWAERCGWGLVCSFPGRMRATRLRLGLSASALDRIAGLVPGRTARIERGGARLRLDTAAAIAEALGVRLDWLATGEGVETWSGEASGRVVVALADFRARRAHAHGDLR